MKYLYNVKFKAHTMLAGALFALLFFALSAPAKDSEPAASGAYVRCAFGNTCDELLIEQIDDAKEEISTAIYSLTHFRITRAFTDAAARGVKISIKYDEKQADWPGMEKALKKLKEAGITCIPVKMKQENAGMHHKFTIIDKSRVLTGSFNYSAAGATKNYENLVLISSKPIAQAFQKEFDHIKNR